MFNCKILHKHNKAQPLDQNLITRISFLSPANEFAGR